MTDTVSNIGWLTGAALNTYAISLYAHILVVVYLLGADLGRVYLARLGGAPGASPDARLLAARGVLFLGTVNSVALILILPAGVSLAASSGTYRMLLPTWLAATWVVTGAWLALTLAADRATGTAGGGRLLAGLDTLVRLALGLGNLYDGALGFAGRSVTVGDDWFAGKLTLYGLLILVSIPVRHRSFGLRRELRLLGLVADDATAAERLASGLARLSLPIVLGWALILGAAWLGAAKPG
ncbi:MAG: hypothetical protein ABI567_09685 [Gammaproteobacteria bacterium]